jgi:hypothetical protein
MQLHDVGTFSSHDFADIEAASAGRKNIVVTGGGVAQHPFVQRMTRFARGTAERCYGGRKCVLQIGDAVSDAEARLHAIREQALMDASCGNSGARLAIQRTEMENLQECP